MAAIKTITPDQLRKAKKAGFKKKKPKKPKASASLTVLENWVSRYNAWIDDAKNKIKEADRKEKEKAKREKLKNQIRNVR